MKKIDIKKLIAIALVGLGLGGSIALNVNKTNQIQNAEKAIEILQSDKEELTKEIDFLREKIRITNIDYSKMSERYQKANDIIKENRQLKGKVNELERKIERDEKISQEQKEVVKTSNISNSKVSKNENLIPKKEESQPSKKLEGKKPTPPKKEEVKPIAPPTTPTKPELPTSNIKPTI